MAEQVTVASGSRLTADELIARAEALVPVLTDRAAEAEELRRVPEETVRYLIDAGLTRVAKPDRYGGCGVDIDTLFEVGWRLARGCGATGWFYTVTQSHDWMMGFAAEEAQEEYFASPDVISSSAFAPTGTTKRSDDGWWISGRWPFSSGVDHAEWVLLGALDPASGLYSLLVPRANVSILDDWFAAGLQGTGSKSVVIEDPVFVPLHREISVGGGPQLEWRDRHARASYGIPPFLVMPYVLATPLVGIAQGAVSEYTERTKKRVFQRGPHRQSAAESPGPQFRIAESAAEADAAVAILRADLRDLLDHYAGGDAPDPLVAARIRLNQCYAAKLSVSAVNRLFDAAGANALLDPSALARMHRDVNAGSHQVAMQWDDAAAVYGQVKFDVASNALW